MGKIKNKTKVNRRIKKRNHGLRNNTIKLRREDKI